MHPWDCQSPSHSSRQQGLSAVVSILLVPVVKPSPLSHFQPPPPFITPYFLCSLPSHFFPRFPGDCYGPRVSRVHCTSAACLPLHFNLASKGSTSNYNSMLTPWTRSHQKLTTQIKLLPSHWEAVTMGMKEPPILCHFGSEEGRKSMRPVVTKNKKSVLPALKTSVIRDRR